MSASVSPETYALGLLVTDCPAHSRTKVEVRYEWIGGNRRPVYYPVYTKDRWKQPVCTCEKRQASPD